MVVFINGLNNMVVKFFLIFVKILLKGGFIFEFYRFLMMVNIFIINDFGC